MFRQWKLATVIAIAISAVVTMNSAEAHIGALVRGARNGGGIGPRARQQGNANAIRPNGNPGVAPALHPVPKTTVTPPVVQQKPPVTPANSSTVKPKTAAPTNNYIAGQTSTPLKSTSDKAPTPTAQAKAVAVSDPAPSKPANTGRLVFSLPVSTVAAETNGEDQNEAAKPMGLPSETKRALEEVIAADVPTAVDAPSEVKPAAELVSKEVALPQIPIGATLTLNGKELSNKEGQVVLQIGEIALPATINEWKNDAVTCTLPVIGITRASKATLHVLKADGKTASTMNFELVTTLTTAAEGKP